MALQEEFRSQGNYLFRNRGNLPLLVLAAGLAVFTWHAWQYRSADMAFPCEGWKYFCLAVSLSGLAIRIYTVGHAAKNTSGRNTEEQVADELNETGIYSLIRHPLYVGNFFMWFGITLMTSDLWFIVSVFLLYWIYIERIMYAEEAFLREKFGDRYLNWAAYTPAVIPAFKNWKASTLGFTWKKVLRQEKNGFFATILIFFTFDVLSASLRAGKPVFEWTFWTYAVIVSGLIYLVLNFLKKRTMILKGDPGEG